MTATTATRPVDHWEFHEARPATSPFRPASPCGPGCVVASGHQVPWPVRSARVVALIAVVCAAAVGASVIRLGRSGRSRRRAGRWILRRTARAILAVLGVRFDPSVALPRDRTLAVANHISWLDVVALLACDDGNRLRLVARSKSRRGR